jgi:hypothetical protein
MGISKWATSVAGVAAASCLLAVTPTVVAQAGDEVPSSGEPRAGRADWTMMVYAVGDTTNVANLMVQNLSQIAALPAADNVNVVVLIDLPARNDAGAPTDTLPGMEQFTTAKLLVLEDNEYVEVADYGELSMGRPEILSGFIKEAADRFPADKYGLTLFDHGSGAAGGYVDTGPPGVTDLSVPEIRDGMASGMAKAGIDRFDLLFHAACLMSNYETASHLAPLAEKMTGSEEIMVLYPVAPAGFPPLAADASGEEVGAALIDGYIDLLDELATQDQGPRDLAAMSSVDGDAIRRLDKAMESFAEVAVEHMDEIAPAVARARSNALEFVVGYGLQSSDLVDLGDFLRELDGLPAEVEVARDAAFAAIEGSVDKLATGRAMEQATGLSVFLPTDPRRVGPYLEDGTAPKGWGEFVRAFLEAGVASAEQGGTGFTSDEAEVLQLDRSGIKIAGQLASRAAAGVGATFAQVFAPLGGQEQALVLEMPAYLNAGGEGQVQGVWGYGVTVLTDGRRQVPVSAGLQDQASGLVGDFLAQYTAPGGATTDIGVRVLLSSEGEIVGVSIVDVSNGAAAGVELENGGTLTPYLFVRGSGGFQQVLSDESITVSDALAVDFARVSSGTPFEMGVLVGDLQGNLDGAFTTQTVP